MLYYFLGENNPIFALKISILEDMTLEKFDLSFFTEEELNFHDNSYDVLYIDDINKNKKKEKFVKEKKEREEKQINDRNILINKLLNIFIIIVVIAIFLSLGSIVFSSKIDSLKEKYEANKTNKEIEKLVEAGELLPAYMYETEDDEDLVEESGISDLITEQPTEIDSGIVQKTSSFVVNDETIHNFNEQFSIIVPDSTYVQSVNDNKVLMLNSEKIYELSLTFKNYEVVEQNGNYYLFVNLNAENKDNPETINIDGVFTATIEKEIIVSNKDNSGLETGKPKDTTLSFNLTEYQYKLIKNELDSIDFVYKDKYNYREIFATYGGNYKK